MSQYYNANKAAIEENTAAIQTNSNMIESISEVLQQMMSGEEGSIGYSMQEMYTELLQKIAELQAEIDALKANK